MTTKLEASFEGSLDACLCGRRLEEPEAVSGGVEHREARCACGRRIAYQLSGSRWTARAILTPEGSVPVSGFSRELRSQPDVERFWFLHPFGGKHFPVHVVFCPSLATVEIKAADRKALLWTDMATASQACLAWIAKQNDSRSRWRPSASNPIGPSARREFPRSVR